MSKLRIQLAFSILNYNRICNANQGYQNENCIQYYQARICMSKFKVNSFIPQKLMKIKKRNN